MQNPLETSAVEKLKLELSVARNEIQNLRKQIKSLGDEQHEEMLQIHETIDRFRKSSTCNGAANDTDEPIEDGIRFKPIGIIKTGFPEMHQVPPFPSIYNGLIGYIEFDKKTFTNPAHSLAGLEEFSHVWIIYHFHQNEAHPEVTCANGGDDEGVFSTRSQHRPCPIGLSLVYVHLITEKGLYFCGTDMLDGTPVLDIKPYIPRYDSPLEIEQSAACARKQPIIPQCSSREEPDGEE